MPGYWNRRPVTEAVQVDSMETLEAWIASIPPEKWGTAWRTYVVDAVEPNTETGGFTIFFRINENDGSGGSQQGLRVEGLFGEYALFSAEQEQFYTLDEETFVSRFEPAI